MKNHKRLMANPIAGEYLNRREITCQTALFSLELPSESRIIDFLMRFLRFLTLAIFCLMSLDISPAALNQTAIASCCCKSGICRCAHAQGQCPMKRQIKSSQQGWNQSSCGVQAQTQAALANSREFLFPSNLFLLPLLVTSQIFLTNSADYSLLRDSRLKRPPRFSF